MGRRRPRQLLTSYFLRRPASCFLLPTSYTPTSYTPTFYSRQVSLEPPWGREALVSFSRAKAFCLAERRCRGFSWQAPVPATSTNPVAEPEPGEKQRRGLARILLNPHPHHDPSPCATLRVKWASSHRTASP